MARSKYYQPSRVKLSKHYVKFIASPLAPKLLRSIIQIAPESVIKGISNAALNLQINPDIKLSQKQKNLFRKSRKVFDKLVDKKITIPDKRKLLICQKGGALPLIPIILSTALGALGSLFLPK